MLPYHIILAIFATLVSQGNVVSAIPIDPIQFNTRGEHIFGRDPVASIKARHDQIHERDLEIRAPPQPVPGTSHTKTSTPAASATIPQILMQTAEDIQGVSAQIVALAEFIHERTQPAAVSVWPEVRADIGFVLMMMAVAAGLYVVFGDALEGKRKELWDGFTKWLEETFVVSVVKYFLI